MVKKVKKISHIYPSTRKELALEIIEQWMKIALNTQYSCGS